MALTPRQKRQRLGRKIGRMMPANPKVKAGEATVSAKDLRAIQRALES